MKRRACGYGICIYAAVSADATADARCGLIAPLEGRLDTLSGTSFTILTSLAPDYTPSVLALERENVINLELVTILERW